MDGESVGGKNSGKPRTISQSRHLIEEMPMKIFALSCFVLSIFACNNKFDFDADKIIFTKRMDSVENEKVVEITDKAVIQDILARLNGYIPETLKFPRRYVLEIFTDKGDKIMLGTDGTAFSVMSGLEGLRYFRVPEKIDFEKYLK